MKTKKYYPVMAVVIGILYIWVPAKRCPSALGQIESPPHQDKPFLIGRAKPELAGIDKLHVAILPSGAEPNKDGHVSTRASQDGLVWTELEAKVINKFNEAGIKLAPTIADSILDIPELRIDIDMLRLEDSQQYVFRIETLLSRAVYLAKKGEITSPSGQELILKPDVWKKESPMQVVSVQNMPAKVTEVVLEQVEVFIQAYHTANPPGVRSADVKASHTPLEGVGTSDTVSQITPEEPSKLPGKQLAAQYRYVASKSSKVFHKPQCRWAEKISPENLVGYNSRDEVTKAGKRPCKLCKP